MTILILTLCLAAPATEPLLLDDFEADPAGWKYIDGREFAGAKGALERVADVAHTGQGSYRLTADFTAGGAYVGTWREVKDLLAIDVAALRLWVKAEGVTELGVRLTDTSGQCHQAKRALQPGPAWQELVLPLGELVGGEHWGGANDGRWHGPLTGFGFNIGKPAVGPDQKGTLWMDDLRADIIPPGVPTLRTAVLSLPAARPAYGLRVTYRWDAQPMGKELEVFVHFIGPDGRQVFQADHRPPGGTTAWSGPVEYSRTIVIPGNAPLGDYAIRAGIWDRGSGRRLPIAAGEGVQDAGGGAFVIGTLPVQADAPLPALDGPKLDLTGYRVTFDEDFTQPLDVSAWGPGTRWIAHTPYAGDFGDARFTDPTADFPFTITDGILRIEAKQIDGKWRAGLLSSADKQGGGFSQQYGYFEARLKLPPGPGTWPAFWLLGVKKLQGEKIVTPEIDVVEQYGHSPHALHTNLHLWYPDKRHTADGDVAIVEGMITGFHTYGVLVDEQHITFYYDRVQLRQLATPEEAKQPLYLLVNLALGSGWPIDKTPDPSHLFVDYVRAWAK